ncbi:MAG: carboxypeptidase regulatory-like domain-containing protein [Prevotella sp.]|jgi:hypothetical protein|nr:carboxypeptidase regulatory-like domain-containing protein [Prevotella sp.]
MGDFFVYIIKSAVCLVVFYLFFRLLLNRDTFHRFNRIAVLCILVLSFIVPLCRIHVNAPAQVNRAVFELHQLFVEPDNVEVISQPDKTFSWTHGVLLVYLAGIIFFIFRNVYFLLCMRRLFLQSKVEKPDSGVKLVVCDNTISPFSWMNYIIISENDLRENGKEIMTHEMAHVRKFHSIDILLADICIVFQWFNPAVWLIKQELQNIHEYEADEYVLKEGIDAKHYQLLLIKKAVGKRLYSMANSFNYSKLKKRITMMSKQKSSPWARLKYLYVLPVTVVAITAFARPEVSNKLDKISEVKVSDFTGMVKVNDVVKNDLPVKDTVDGFVLTDIQVKNAGDKKQAEKDSFADKSFELKVINGSTSVKSDSDGNLALNVSGDATVEMTTPKGQMQMKSENMFINLSSVQISRSADVTKRISGIVKDSSGNPVAGATIVVVGTKTGTVTVTDMNGKFALDAPDDATLSISMKDMKSAAVKVGKSKSLVITLAPQGSGENVIIASDYSVENNVLNLKDVVVYNESKSPLIVIDGKVSVDGIGAIDPNEIASLKVLRKEEGIKQYGDEGKNGVIIITTKSKDK